MLVLVMLMIVGCAQAESSSGWSDSFIANLSKNDCKGIASGDKNYCSSKDCKGLAKKDANYCETSDCKGVARKIKATVPLLCVKHGQAETRVIATTETVKGS